MRHLVLAALVLFSASNALAQQERAARTILAIGAHAGDMELTCGALLARQAQRGDRVVLLHLTRGERGNAKLTPQAYGEQKEREAREAASVLGGEVRFGPWRDGEIPNDEDARRWVAAAIRDVRPTLVITHWKTSMHKDHAVTSEIVRDAVLLASLEGIAIDKPVWRGVRSVWFAENWEDPEGFAPYVYADVAGSVPAWREAVTKYEFVRGGISSFAYLDYYTALFTLRGAEARKPQAVAFDIEPYGKKRVLDDVP